MCKPVVCVLALFCLSSGINAASIAGTFDEKPIASVLPEFVAGDLTKPAPEVEASILPEFVAGDLTKPAPEVIASVLPEFVAGDLTKPAPEVEASVLPEFVAGELTKPAPEVEAVCDGDNIQEEIIALPEIEIELPVVPEVIENPCSDAVDVEEEAAPVVPEIEVIIPEAPVVRPLPEEEESAIAPEIEVVVPEVDACVEEEVAVEAPVASILPAPVVVDASQLISAQPIKLN